MNAHRAVEAEVRVRYAETDAQGVVYYANFFVWFEVGRMTYMRERGWPYDEMERNGIGFMVMEATCRYHAPARFDDQIIIRTWVDEVRQRSFGFAYEVLDKVTGERLATGRTVQVFVDGEGKPVAIPARVRARLGGGEGLLWGGARGGCGPGGPGAGWRGGGGGSSAGGRGGRGRGARSRRSFSTLGGRRGYWPVRGQRCER